MASSKYTDDLPDEHQCSVVREGDIEDAFIDKLRSLKYTVRPDIHDRASLEQNFREKFEALNRVNLTDAEFARLLDEIITLDVFTAAKTLRGITAFILATASINDAIEYHSLFKTMQAEKQAADPEFRPLNIACVFSPPAEGDRDVQQIQEDLPQEKADNEEDPEGKKAALKAILADYNTRYGTNHKLGEFDLYYQDVQKRIKDQQWPNADYPHAQKIDITIVVDMLLTGFDSKYLNTLYVDKNLRHHGLIQAFSRTNRVLNGTKPYGNILDFRQQQAEVDAAIALFSGEKTGEQAREIWLVDKAPVVIQKLQAAVQQLDAFMRSQGLDTAPEAVPNLKGDAARACFIERFKEVQRLKTQLDQYTDLTGEDKAAIAAVLPEEQHRGFKGAYLETAQRLKAQQGKTGKDDQPAPDDTDQIDFEFVLFASAVIDYDYIMGLIARFSEKGPGKAKMTREQLIGLISSDAKFMNESDDIAAYINTLKAGEGLSETAIREGYTRFKAEKNAAELATIAQKHGLAHAALQTFVDAMAEIEKNDFNLNISRYISTAVGEEEINLAATHEDLVAIEQKIQDATQRHNEFLKELGLPPIPLRESNKL